MGLDVPVVPEHAGHAEGSVWIVHARSFRVEGGSATEGVPACGFEELREAVTNILRHSAAGACVIEVAIGAGALRLRVSNDGVTTRAAAGPWTTGGVGGGLANMTGRIQAAGGQFACGRTGGRFELTAQIPLSRAGQGEANRWLRLGCRM